MKRSPLVVLLSLALFSACATQRSWVYSANVYGTPAKRKQTVVVLPFRDARNNVNHNRAGLYAIPLMPFGWQDYEVPEGATAHISSALWMNYKPTEDYPKALAEELRGAGFEGAFFDFKEGDADLAIHGTIESTRYSGKIFSYGLSVYGPMLWLIGLPAGTASNDLEVELACEDRKTGQTLLSKRYRAPTYQATSWLYVMANDFNYPDMLKEAYREFVQDLTRAVP